jgi:hypothetical protein
LLSGNFFVLRQSVFKRINMFLKFLFIIIIFAFFYSCTTDSLEDKNTISDVVIKTGTVCGWCTVNDTLTITRNSVRYVNYANCITNKPSVEKTGLINTVELEGLLAKLVFSELKKLDLNSCNVCFDGCDDWIYFSKGTEDHYIRFSKNDPKLQPILAFVDQLNAIKAQYTAQK